MLHPFFIYTYDFHICFLRISEGTYKHWALSNNLREDNQHGIRLFRSVDRSILPDIRTFSVSNDKYLRSCTNTIFSSILLEKKQKKKKPF